ncbi:molybdenum ABC transporter ATP-binding protein [Acidocella sp.]|uniref:molybdenum ABC transporter ATP-binding protein n=1 Tax=Acidocella sp. TaxID=50710 RepID=UPI0017C52EE7|nr:molybdenum ABC transporter ATP-binding protein [Acidocella sp.]NNM57811.1 molybdenum ABC transporter ATP-binding protein [Acidocella sp.]
MSRIIASFQGSFGGFRLDAGFDIPAGGRTGLFGPSGCGKSTVLRCMAGLVRLQGGNLRVGGEVWQEDGYFLPPYKRAVGYVFQDARLFTHLSVRDNLRFGLRRAGGGRIAEADVVEFLGLAPLLGRYPAALSGGERQRVAIGRTLLAQPRLLLMDEPLAALDRESAEQILPRLREVSARFGVPVLYVSHQMDEIERIAQHLLLMRAGRVMAAGALTDLLTDLSLPFAARDGAATVLELTVSAYDETYGLTLAGAPPLCLTVPGWLGAVGAVIRLRVRASDVSLLRRPASSSVLNLLPTRILAADIQTGPHVLVVLGVGEARLLARITRKSWDQMGLALGQEIFAQVKAEALAGA